MNTENFQPMNKEIDLFFFLIGFYFQKWYELMIITNTIDKIGVQNKVNVLILNKDKISQYTALVLVTLIDLLFLLFFLFEIETFQFDLKITINDLAGKTFRFALAQ